MTSQTDFFVELDGAVDGPMSGIEVRELALGGKLTPQTRIALARGEAKLRWVPARKLTGLFDAAGNALPHPPLTQAYLEQRPGEPDSAGFSRPESVLAGSAGPAGGEVASLDSEPETPPMVVESVLAPTDSLARDADDQEPVNAHDAFQWHYSYEGQPFGPVSYSQLLELVAELKIDQQTLVWREGWEDWVSAGQVEGLISNS